MFALTKLLLKPSEELTFNFEPFVKKELGINLEKGIFDWLREANPVEICQYYLKNQCRMGSRCAFKHPSKTKLVVCKHWLRGLCKKGELCEFLHEYNLKKMPECWFYTKLGECTNPECLYLHIDPESKMSDCAWYARGFCKHGNECRNKHTRQAVCPNYLTGFCPKGSNCSFGHPKFELPTSNVVLDLSQADQEQQRQQQSNRQNQGGGRNDSRDRPQRSISEVTCFKCGETGHFANNCPNQFSQQQNKRQRYE